jgi:hypothetical protein
VEGDSLRTAVVFDHEEADTCFVLVELEDSFGHILNRAFTIRIEADNSGSTGIIPIVEEQDLLYPNPADDLLIWRNPDPNLALEIYEVATGRKLEMKLGLDGTMDVSGLQDGVYLVVIRSSGAVTYQKLVVHH